MKAHTSDLSQQQQQRQWCAKLLCCNAYQIAAPFVNKFNATCTDHSKRASALGALIASERADIVMLQEMWGGGQRALEEALSTPAAADSTAAAVAAATQYVVPRRFRSWWGWSVLDTAAQYTAKRGGLWYAHRANSVVEVVGAPKIAASALAENKAYGEEQKLGDIVYPFQHTFSFSNSKSRKGVCVTKFLPVTAKDEGKGAGGEEKVAPAPALLVFNTHLDPSNENRGIERQLLELGDVIRYVLTAEAEAASSFVSAAAPTAKSAALENRLNIAAVIVGDFNITPDSAIYRRLVSGEALLSLASGGGQSGVSGAAPRNNRVQLRELLGTASKAIHTYDADNKYVLWPESRGRLDHIFAIDGLEGLSDPDMCPPLRLASVALEADAVLKAPLVSDHYPFTATLRIGE